MVSDGSYHLPLPSDIHKSFTLVMKKNRELRKQQRKERLAKKAREIAAQEADTGSRKQQSKQASIFDETVTQAITKKESYKRAREERQRKEDDKEKDGQAIWAEIEELDPSIPNEIVGMDKNLMREYMKLAEQAYQDFVNTRAFFPHDRVSCLNNVISKTCRLTFWILLVQTIHWILQHAKNHPCQGIT